MITKISSHRKGAVSFWFDNGNNISIIFGPGTYSDNHDADWDIRTDQNTLDSETVEIMPGGSTSFIKWMEKKYDGVSVVGYVPVADIPMILKRAEG